MSAVEVGDVVLSLMWILYSGGSWYRPEAAPFGPPFRGCSGMTLSVQHAAGLPAAATVRYAQPALVGCTMLGLTR